MPIYEVSSLLLFCIGLWGFFDNKHIIKKILALNIIGQGIFLLLISFSKRAAESGHDPIPHAMVLTGIVVAVCATSFALYIARRYYDMTGHVTVEKDGVKYE